MTNTGFRFALSVAAIAASAIFSSGSATLAQAAEVQNTPEIVGKRIVIAGRQRMLAEAMAKSVCYLKTGVDTEDSLRDLYVTWNTYGWYHRGLRLGNVQLELFEEKHRRVQRKWSDVDDAWSPMSKLHVSVLEGNDLSDVQFVQMITLTEHMVGLSNELVSELRSSYAKDIGKTGRLSALLIDLYERERMLAQKLAKAVCLIDYGYETEATRAELKKTLGFFNASIEAFLDGAPSVSIPPAPTPEMRAQLASAKSHWDGIRHIATAVAEGGNPTADDMLLFRDQMDQFLSDMTMSINMLVEFEANKT